MFASCIGDTGWTQCILAFDRTALIDCPCCPQSDGNDFPFLDRSVYGHGIMHKTPHCQQHWLCLFLPCFWFAFGLLSPIIPQLIFCVPPPLSTCFSHCTSPLHAHASYPEVGLSPLLWILVDSPFTHRNTHFLLYPHFESTNAHSATNVNSVTIVPEWSREERSRGNGRDRNRDGDRDRDRRENVSI